MVVKVTQDDDLIAMLEATFTNLHRFCVKLRTKMCVLGVPSGKLLGYIISMWSIEVNLKKIAAIAKMGPTSNVKGVQKLTGYLAPLNHFIS